MLTTCEHLMADICAGLGAELREFNGQTDHIHLLVHYPPSLAVSMLVNRPKGVSSRRLAPAIPNTGSEVPVGQELLVTVLLRRLLRRTPDHHQALHRTTKPPPLTSKQPPPPATKTGSASSRP